MTIPAMAVIEGKLQRKIKTSQGKKVRLSQWSECYCKLQGDTLQIAPNDGTSSQTITLTGSSIALPKTKKSHVFELKSELEESFFQANSMKDLLEWMKAIEEICENGDSVSEAVPATTKGSKRLSRVSSERAQVVDGKAVCKIIYRYHGQDSRRSVLITKGMKAKDVVEKVCKGCPEEKDFDLYFNDYKNETKLNIVLFAAEEEIILTLEKNPKILLYAMATADYEQYLNENDNCNNTDSNSNNINNNNNNNSNSNSNSNSNINSNSNDDISVTPRARTNTTIPTTSRSSGQGQGQSRPLSMVDFVPLRVTFHDGPTSIQKAVKLNATTTARNVIESIDGVTRGSLHDSDNSLFIDGEEFTGEDLIFPVYQSKMSGPEVKVIVSKSIKKNQTKGRSRASSQAMAAEYKKFKEGLKRQAPQFALPTMPPTSILQTPSSPSANDKSRSNRSPVPRPRSELVTSPCSFADDDLPPPPLPLDKQSCSGSILSITPPPPIEDDDAEQNLPNNNSRPIGGKKPPQRPPSPSNYSRGSSGSSLVGKETSSIDGIHDDNSNNGNNINNDDKEDDYVHNDDDLPPPQLNNDQQLKDDHDNDDDTDNDQKPIKVPVTHCGNADLLSPDDDEDLTFSHTEATAADQQPVDFCLDDLGFNLDLEPKEAENFDDLMGDFL